jgi:hypothetical protein
MVEDLLDQHRDEQTPGHEGHGQADRVADAGSELRRLADPAPEQVKSPFDAL